jgi:nitrate reductase delta subunit
MMTARQQVYRYFGDLLDYPTPALARQGRDCAALLLLSEPAAADLLYRFVHYVDDTPLGRVEEIYTGTFDVNPACYIFAGYMLFGESFARGKFLVRLQERYRERGFDWGGELADHVPVILRFLSTLDPDEELARQLVDKCLIPVLEQMSGNFKLEAERVNPYAYVLQASLNVLEQTQPKESRLQPVMAEQRVCSVDC